MLKLCLQQLHASMLWLHDCKNKLSSLKRVSSDIPAEHEQALIDWVKVLCPTWHKIGHFGDIRKYQKPTQVTA